MCGFVGMVSRLGGPIDEAMLARMTGLLAHRGPDGGGMFVEGALGLGFRRLAIFDLAPSGDQPMFSADGRHVIVFNGAIYNFVELRVELEGLGHAFRSTGDTEVLLAAYRQWGRDCLHRLNGMWAFLVYDRVERRMFGARDRFGVKPLFWRRDGGSVVFTSEIKAIRDSGFARLDVDWQTLAEFLVDRRLDASDRTLYRGVNRVPAGVAFEVDAAGDIEWWRYWSVIEAAEAAEPPADPAGAYAELFEDAVRLRMRSDVPVGVLLSGGLDSTSVICSMARQLGEPHLRHADLTALCYFDPEFGESTFIDATLEQTRASLSRLHSSPAELWDTLPEQLWHQDEPVHSINSVVLFQLMKLARSQGVKVVLSGQGADEVLGGYSNYFLNYWVELLRAGRPQAAWREVESLSRELGQSALAHYSAALRVCLKQMLHSVPGYTRLADQRRRREVGRCAWLSNEVRQHWRPAERMRASTLNEALRWSLERANLPLYLRVEDRNSMAQGVEMRTPFLDHRLVSLAFRLGPDWKLRGACTKVLLRESMRDRVPEVVRTRPGKFGFPVAVDSWFRGELYEPLKDMLASRTVRESGLWNVSQVDQDLDRHRRGDVNIGVRLFDVIQSCLWIQGFGGRPTTYEKVPSLSWAGATR
jgi:asparagine synthase (glutamine-hydrolysing)